ncbi:MAG: hypothetical protein JWL65_6929 [Gammaproteobacteria bacterium]|nr:hypothetical protein [Gammaproteobacteria bacterium]
MKARYTRHAGVDEVENFAKLLVRLAVRIPNRPEAWQEGAENNDGEALATGSRQYGKCVLQLHRDNDIAFFNLQILPSRGLMGAEIHTTMRGFADRGIVGG